MSGENNEMKTESQPVVILFIGMAGSGKTTLMQRVNSYLISIKSPPYTINFDPAAASVPFPVNIDIRDTIEYKKVMAQYNLGPNGAILTSLNIFATKFNQVLGFIEKQSTKKTKYILIDTPGQIEIFTWSASGTIITDALAASYPTIVFYVVDTPRTRSPPTFMSNMLYACSILYKTKLPFIVVFNKTDIVSYQFAIEWMTDFEAFQAAISSDREDGGSYMNSLMNSMCLLLEEFYNSLSVVGVSAITGSGMRSLFEAADKAVDEYNSSYKPELEKLIKQKKDEREKEKAEQLSRLMSDLDITKGGAPVDLGSLEEP